MGLTNWALNRIQSGKNITIKATTPYGLDSEVAKYEKKGYIRVGAPYTGKAGAFSSSEYYQSMTLQDNATEAQAKTANSVSNQQEGKSSNSKTKQKSKKQNNEHGNLGKSKKLSTKQIVIGAICLGIILLLLIRFVSSIRFNAMKEDGICAHIGDRYINENIYESDIEEAKFFNCSQATFDRLNSQKAAAEEEEAEEEAERKKEEEELEKKKSECAANGKTWMGGECITKEEAEKRTKEQEKRKAAQSDCSAKGYDWNYSYDRCNSDIEQQTVNQRKEDDKKKKEAEEASESQEQPSATVTEDTTPSSQSKDTIPEEELTTGIAACDRVSAAKLKVANYTRGYYGGDDYVWYLVFKPSSGGQVVCRYNWKTGSAVITN